MYKCNLFKARPGNFACWLPPRANSCLKYLYFNKQKSCNLVPVNCTQHGDFYQPRRFVIASYPRDREAKDWKLVNPAFSRWTAAYCCLGGSSLMIWFVTPCSWRSVHTWYEDFIWGNRTNLQGLREDKTLFCSAYLWFTLIRQVCFFTLKSYPLQYWSK